MASFNNATRNAPATPPAKYSRRGTKVREVYFGDGVNRKSLHAIETAAFMVFLEDTHYTTLNDRARSLFHGSGSNRWFDKSINLVVYEDGYAGLNCEHSWADAPAVAHLLEFAFLSELIDFQNKTPKRSPVTGEASDTVAPLSSDEAVPTVVANKSLPVPRRLLWEVDDELQVAIDQAHQFANSIIADVDLQVVEFLDFGKGFIKKCRMSPDGFVQMALQLAYFRQQGKFDLTYESSMTRLFRGGRTETTRTLGAESVAFVEAVEAGAPKEEIIAKLRIATDRHADKNKLMMAGRGIDRHLFALYIVSKGMNRSSDFLNQALSVPWRLSTSQQPQDQTLLRKFLPKDVSERFVSPGGGFGPVADDGYGVSYMITGEKHLYFHVSSKHSAPDTSSEDFVKEIFKALRDMAALFK